MKFNFFLAGVAGPPVNEYHPVWKQPLPVSRFKTNTCDPGFISHGEYFRAVEAFLGKNNLQRIVSSIYRKSNSLVSPDTIESVSVYLDKHGEYYHPARIEVSTGKKCWEFVLNVAVSEAGFKCADREFKLLAKLRRDLPWEFIPDVYETGDVGFGMKETKIRMVMGKWFSGYNEFHIHSTDHDGKCLFEVWSREKDHFFLSERQVYSMYRQVALIHTCYHNVKTFEQIHPWHHAAGDFVIKVDDEDRVQVKLVTVRGYYPLMRNDDQDMASVLEAMLVFLADLSIKNRIDRFKGVGDLAWANDLCVMATIDGFYEGLALKADRNLIQRDIIDYFSVYLVSRPEAEIQELFSDILSTWPPQAPERSFVEPRIQSHASLFYRFANHLLSGDAGKAF